METPDLPPDPVPDGIPGPKKKRVVSEESKKNLRRGVMPSVRELEGSDADGADGSSTGDVPRPAGTRLADMQYVYDNKAGRSETQGQKVCRGWLEEDARGFMMALLKLEADQRAVVEAPAEDVKAVVPPDEGEQRVRGLIGKILAKAERAVPLLPR